LPQRNLAPSFDSARRLLSDVLTYQHRNHFLGEFMPKVDGATMYYSIESRSPFLDQKLWEFAARLPPGMRFRHGVLKAVLREIVRRRVDPATASRPKRGFTVPVERWLAERWTGALDRLTQPTELEGQGWIRKGSLDHPIQDARARRWVPTQLWYLLILEHWLERQSTS
jgi:asparagine synthase (glutamine-hydrolysing)